jgi:antitoxin component of MazEF toxin-antitoxin module
MATFPLQLSNQASVVLPTELARQAGLEAGEVQVILGAHRLIMLPATPSIPYAKRWEAMSAALREQAVRFDLSEDRRDADYWNVVAPLFEETERALGSV